MDGLTMARIMEVWPELFLEKEGGGVFFVAVCGK